jgi:hypothetical protein
MKRRVVGPVLLDGPRNSVADREQAIRLGILPEEQVPHWTEIEDGRFQPRRTRGSYRGRELA